MAVLLITGGHATRCTRGLRLLGVPDGGTLRKFVGVMRAIGVGVIRGFGVVLLIFLVGFKEAPGQNIYVFLSYCSI